MKSPLNRGGLRFYLVLIALVRGAATHTTILAGIPCILLGVALHVWAKGCLRQNQFVATIGPYRFVRHPFYLANALIDAGIAVMSGWWVLQFGLPFWWFAIYIPVMRREENYLTETFGPIYEEYKRRVPRLIPWRRPLEASEEGFRWSNPNIAGGEEIPRALRILAYPLLFLVCTDLRIDELAFWDDGLKTLTLGMFAVLQGFAWELERHQRRRRRIMPQAAERPAVRIAVAAVVLVAAFLTKAPITAIHAWVLPAGAVLMVISVPVFSDSRARGLAAECLAMIGILVASERLWLVAVPMLLYAAWILDSLLPEERQTETSSPLAPG